MFSSKDYKDIVSILRNVGEEASKKILEIYNSEFKVNYKGDNSPLTQADTESNNIICSSLKEKFPKIPIISEETVNLNEKNTNSIFWLIDPIDGTKEYIAGKDEYTLNAALVINKKPIIGLVGVPKKKQLYYTYGFNKSFVKEKNSEKKLSCKKNSFLTLKGGILFQLIYKTMKILLLIIVSSLSYF